MANNLNQRNQRVDASRFSMVPRADIPRSTFKTVHTHKTTIDGAYLYPIIVDEVLPGDSTHGTMTLFARMSTLIFPLMDHVTLESFFFFVPARLLWTNWRKMMGERDNPADSISYTVPQYQTLFGPGPADALTLLDYMGIPNGAQLGGRDISINALPIRAYAMIWNEWFRDENLQDEIVVNLGDGPDTAIPALLRRNKKHDYFTSALPWPLKNNAGVVIPLQGNAPVIGIGSQSGLSPTVPAVSVYETNSGGSAVAYPFIYDSTQISIRANVGTPNANPQIYADLSQATGATIAALRLAVQTQRLLERDARSGTRYTELLKAHFGVMPEDSRLQRPEYIGGGRTTLQTQAIPQTSETATTPLAGLAGAATMTGQHEWTLQATEHGYLIGLVNVDAELTYQQGLHRMWTRSTRFDFYWPVFAHLSEQALRKDEIYYQANAQDDDTWGYQERWAEYRHRPSRISGLFRSTAAGTIDEWHSAQNFGSPPTLSETFIHQAPPFARNLAAGMTADGMQFLLDTMFEITSTRALPMYSVPGGMDRF